MRTTNSLLVTGGAGFIGSAFIRYMLRLPEFHGKILNYDLLTYAASLGYLKGVEGHPRYRFVQGDICNRELVQRLMEEQEVDTIVHFAAETHVDRSIASAERFVQTNVLGTLQMLEAARQMPKVHFHHISTDEVFGSLGESGAFSEHSPYRPNSPYSASKAGSDHMVRAFAHTYGLSTTMSHCSNNYGPCQHPEKFIPLMISRCLQRQPLPVYGRGVNVRDWLYVDDHAAAIWKILQKGKKGQTYSIGGRTEMSNLELLHLLIELLQKKQPGEYKSLIRFVQDRPGHDFRYAIDCSKIEQELEWRAETPLAVGLSKTIDWCLHVSRNASGEALLA
jgi:dTDP-glucose 4,6-dehydratase